MTEMFQYEKNYFISYYINIIFISSRKPIQDDLSDMKCNACGGKYHYKTTVNLIDSTYYYYVCDICGKEISTRIWREK